MQGNALQPRQQDQRQCLPVGIFQGQLQCVHGNVELRRTPKEPLRCRPFLEPFDWAFLSVLAGQGARSEPGASYSQSQSKNAQVQLEFRTSYGICRNLANQCLQLH